MAEELLLMKSNIPARTRSGRAKFQSFSVEKEVAVRQGFEPWIRGYRIHAFQACAFNHSATSPQGRVYRGRC
jgi:hypothetical protein